MTTTTKDLKGLNLHIKKKIVVNLKPQKQKLNERETEVNILGEQMN